MRLTCTLLLLALCGGAALAQNSGQTPAASASSGREVLLNSEQSDTTPGRGNQRVQRMRIEDAGSRVDEVRYAGQTESITVQPKLNVPPYEIVPADGARSARPFSREGNGLAGQRVWNVLGF